MGWSFRSAAAISAALITTVAAPAAHAKDYADYSRAVLAPGQAGGLPTTTNSTDQVPLYDGLTPLFDKVSANDVNRLYKPNVFGVRGQTPTTTERTPNKNVRIVNDKWGVPHITARKRDDVMYGAGFVAARDRSLLLELARGPGRLAILDAPGIDAFGLIVSGRTFVASPQADRFINKQVALLRKAGPRGRQTLSDIDAYVEGINGYYETANRLNEDVQPWTRADFLALQGFIGSIFGRGGGDEARRAQFLSALTQHTGSATTAQRIFDDMRNVDDPETFTSSPRRAPYNPVPSNKRGNATIDAGSFQEIDFGKSLGKAADAEKPRMSNALLIGAKKSATRHPIFVAGPQLGYYYPEIVGEMELQGGGISVRGIASTGAGPYVFIGRGEDFSWSLTSAGNDIIDQYVETLCDGSDTKYMYKGKCRNMTRTVAGVLKGAGGAPDTNVTFNETVHGPVVGYATSNGQRVAVSTKRSTRNREVLSLLLFNDLNSGRVDSAREFIRRAPQLEHTFNVFYADDEDIAFYSTGRLPIRPKNVDPGLPPKGTGEYEWDGYLSKRGHPQTVNPSDGYILNWNNKPAHGFGSADDEWSYGSVHRVELFEDGTKATNRHRAHTVVATMNKAATQDGKTVELLPTITEVLKRAPAPNARAQRMLDLANEWNAEGASRLDRDLDGKIDHPGAAVMDAWYPKLGDAALRPVMGDLTTNLAQLNGRGSISFGGGWYSYLDKDLRTLLGEDVEGKYKTRYCGGGDAVACAQSLWAALDAAGTELEAAQGADPAAWRADAARERIRFQPGLIPETTMRWTNRPTYQQVSSYDGHRPRK